MNATSIAQTTGQITLPPIDVEAKKQTAKKAQPKRTQAPVAAAPSPAASEFQADSGARSGQGETSTGPVDGYVATVSGTGAGTDTPILEIPQSVSVVTADQMKDQGAQSLKEALRYTPGVYLELNSDSRYDEARIRGFIPVQYLDGMAVPFNQYFGTPRIESYGLERIEALKGPASFLFGQNSPGGLLNMITKRPTAERLNEVEFQYGSFNSFQTNFDFSGAANADKSLLYRLTGVVRDADTVVDHTRDDRFYIAPAFTWRPMAGTSLTVLANYGNDQGTFPHQYVPPEGTVLPNPNGKIPRSRFLGEPGFDKFEREQFSIGYILDHRIDSTWSVKQSLRYAGADMFFRAMRAEGYIDPGKTTVGRGAYWVDSDAQTFTVDNQAQANFRTGPFEHKVVFGVDYMRTTGDYAFSGARADPISGLSAAPINVFNPVYGGFINPAGLFQKNTIVQDQLGVYAQDQIKYGSWLLTLGGRHDWVENATDDRIASSTVSRSDSAFTGRAGLSYLFANGVAPYVSYGTSFQPTAGVDAFGQPFKPTTGNQIEAGIKYQPPGTRTLITAAVFDIEQQDSITFDPNPPYAGHQTGEIRVRGFDFEAKSSLTRNIDIIVSYAYLDSETTKSTNPLEIGRVVPLVPTHQASAWGKYIFREGPLAGFGAGAGVRYVGPSYAEISSLDPLRIPEHTLVDAALFYDLGKWNPSLAGAELALNVTNVFDTYYVGGYCDTIFCSLGPGRNVISTLRYRW